MPDSICHSRILYTRTHPNVFTPLEMRRQFSGSFRSLREHLEGVTIALIHHMKDPLDEIERNIFMKEITHGVDEDRAGPPRVVPKLQIQVHIPIQRPRPLNMQVRCLLPGFCPASIAALAIPASPSTSALHSVCTARTDFPTAHDRIPSCLSPLDGRRLRHECLLASGANIVRTVYGLHGIPQVLCRFCQGRQHRHGHPAP